MNNRLFFDTNGPTTALGELLTLFEIKHGGSLPEIMAATQQSWYQKGRLRADIEERHGDKRDAAIPIFRRLGLVDEIIAPKLGERYECCFVLGAKKKAVRKRIAALKKAWEERSIRFDDLILCGSNRPNDESVTEDWENSILPFPQPPGRVLAVPATEAAMMMAVHELASGSLPWSQSFEWRKRPIFRETTVVGRSANTRDTLVDWEADLPRPQHSVLIVSSQPFVSYQLMIAGSCFPRCRHIDAIGFGADPALPISTYLDNIAKILFEMAD